MKPTTIALSTLATALVASNMWWAYHAVDTAITLDHQGVSLREHHEALAQALAILPIVARCDAIPAQVLETARRATSDTTSFEKEGFTWIGRLGLKFDSAGHLAEAAPAWEPF